MIRTSRKLRLPCVTFQVLLLGCLGLWSRQAAAQDNNADPPSLGEIISSSSDLGKECWTKLEPAGKQALLGKIAKETGKVLSEPQAVGAELPKHRHTSGIPLRLQAGERGERAGGAHDLCRGRR